MKKTISCAAIILLISFSLTSRAQAQAEISPVLFNQSGETIDEYDSTTNSLKPGWYYSVDGEPRYYYANGVYYNPLTQSYGGSVVYPDATGPQSLTSAAFTPGVPNTGAGGEAPVFVVQLLLAGIFIATGISSLICMVKNSNSIS